MSRRFTSLTAFIFLVLSYYAYRFPNRSRTSTRSAAPPQNSTASNHIVRFLRYNKAEELREYLEHKVKSSGWKWVQRRNPATRFPTDFALVTIEDRHREFLIGEFGKLELVKDISLDMSYQRGILSADAFGEGKKRPGKIFTAMSFTEEENAVPTNASWRRNLMMQVGLFLSLLVVNWDK